MKMTYHRGKKKNKGLRFIAGIIVFVLFYFLLSNTILRQPLVSLTTAIASPFWQAKEYITERVSSYTHLVRTKESLLEENRLLKENLSAIALEAYSRDLLKSENLALKKLFGRIDTNNFLLAVVLAKPNRSPYDTLVVDVGRDHGITNGASVLAEGDIMIGRVEEVSAKTSKVRLLSSPGEKFDVAVGEENIAAIAYGIGGGNFEIRMPRDAEVAIGDAVVAPNINIEFLGAVEEIRVVPNDPFQTLLMKMPVNIFELKWVIVPFDEF